MFVKKPDPHDEAMIILKDQLTAPPTQVDQLTAASIRHFTALLINNLPNEIHVFYVGNIQQKKTYGPGSPASDATEINRLQPSKSMKMKRSPPVPAVSQSNRALPPGQYNLLQHTRYVLGLVDHIFSNHTLISYS